MKGLKSFQQLIRVLHKNGKLDNAVSHKLTVIVERLQHDLRVEDRRNASKHFEVLCDIMCDALER